MVIAGGRGCVEVEEVIRRLNGYGKNTIRMNFKTVLSAIVNMLFIRSSDLIHLKIATL